MRLCKNLSLKNLKYRAQRIPQKDKPKKGIGERKYNSIFSQDFFFSARCDSRRHTLCISRLTQRSDGGKGRLKSNQIFSKLCPYKKGAGRKSFAPLDSHFAVSDHQLWLPTNSYLRRQNLTALCAAASQNLAAIGSCHSLTETVHLGSVATAGLIGTLHLFVHLLSNSQYARQPFDCSGT